MWCYLFWHSPRPGVDPALYEQMLTTFQRRLATAAQGGGLSLTAETARAPGLPWRPLDARARTFEDAYWVEAMADLERLNRLAVEGAMRSSHDRAAILAAKGQGGLYELRFALRPPPVEAVWSTWLDKPEGATYDEFDAGLGAAAEAAGGFVLRRAMVLSPAPEYLVRSAEPVARWHEDRTATVCRRAPVGAAR
jgi:hypothetical protein